MPEPRIRKLRMMGREKKKAGDLKIPYQSVRARRAERVPTIPEELQIRMVESI